MTAVGLGLGLDNYLSKIIKITDAVLITGGFSSGRPTNTAELYVPSSGLSCSLPHLPLTRVGHSMESTGLICGDSYRNNCLQWKTGTWEEALKLDVVRQDHMSWTPNSGSGTYLMGGDYSQNTTTLITPDKTQEPGFPLKYNTL